MGEFSLSHWLIFLVIILIFVGPSKLPGLGKGLGEAIRGFKKGLNTDEPEAPVDPNRQLTGNPAARSQESVRQDSVKKDEKIQS